MKDEACVGISSILLFRNTLLILESPQLCRMLDAGPKLDAWFAGTAARRVGCLLILCMGSFAKVLNFGERFTRDKLQTINFIIYIIFFEKF